MIWVFWPLHSRLFCFGIEGGLLVLAVYHCQWLHSENCIPRICLLKTFLVNTGVMFSLHVNINPYWQQQWSRMLFLIVLVSDDWNIVSDHYLFLTLYTFIHDALEWLLLANIIANFQKDSCHNFRRCVWWRMRFAFVKSNYYNRDLLWQDINLIGVWLRWRVFIEYKSNYNSC